MTTIEAPPGTTPSAREVEVLTLVSHGKSNGEVGREMCLSEGTIKTHLRRLYRKLDARDRAHAVRIGFERGLITTDREAATAPTPLPTTQPNGRPLRLAIDADCPRCGHVERFYEPGRGVFGCTRRVDPCGYESTGRDQ